MATIIELTKTQAHVSWNGFKGKKTSWVDFKHIVSASLVYTTLYINFNCIF